MRIRLQKSAGRSAPWLTLAAGVVLGAAGWHIAVSGTRPAAAAGMQIPDAGAQRQVMIEELREANRKLAEITRILRQSAQPEGQPERPPGTPKTPTGRPGRP